MKLPLSSKDNSWLKKYFAGLSMFFFSIAAAYFIGWNNTDLIWSFWITSLVVGYVTIFRTSAAPPGILIKRMLNPEDIKNFRELTAAAKLKTAIFFLVFIPIVLFTVVFLSFHFFIFHILLAYWLQLLMPHSGIADILANAKNGGFYVSAQVIQTLLMSYWIIILQKLIVDYKTYWKKDDNIAPAVQVKFFSFEDIKRPYIQVVRIIALMVLLFWLNSIGANQYLVYIVIYSLFFFPFPNFRKDKL